MVYLYNIQPGEDLLRQESLNYFLNNSDRLFKEEPQINLIRIKGNIYDYYVIEGNSRLFVCHMLGLTNIPIEPEKENDLITRIYSEDAKKIYLEGIRGWEDLERRIFPEKMRERIINRLEKRRAIKTSILAKNF